MGIPRNSETQLQQVSVVLAVLLATMLDTPRFAFEVKAWEMLAETRPEILDFHLGILENGDGNKVVAVWLGDLTHDEMEAWLEDNAHVMEGSNAVGYSDTSLN
jgi:hypothetical protein